MKSITMKWMLAILLLLTLLIGSMILVNSVFLEKYYIFKTKATFVNEYEVLLEQYKESTDNEFLSILKKQNSNTGYKYLVVNEKYDVILSSAPEFQIDDRFELTRFLKKFLSKHQNELSEDKIFYQALKSDDNSQYDIVLAAKLKRDYFLLITKPVQQISDNVAIANDFIIMIGIGVLIIGALIAYYMSRRIVRPLLEITKITSKIAHLDFSKRYKGTLKDEVGILGQSINKISEKLHSTISDLNQANTDLQAELQLQKRFLASVSHEFKSPVGLIRGYAESLQLGMAQNKEEAEEFTAIILQETDHLSRLISDIILLMHMDSGTFHIDKKKFNLAVSIQDIINKHAQMPTEKPLQFRTEIPSILPVCGDEGRIIQVLENLISNGIRHVDSRGILLITAKQLNDQVKVEVYNSGNPIPEKHLPHLFNAFYSAHDSRSRNKTGSGLGLSIVNSIMQKHGGECGVLNKEDGVVFWFSLPVSKD
ncbi:sensor histidine kinase [Vallitalea guaymasensis]|uniref:sensor histidine kinase n=1 Tax=Vallitalea guaymasensis TaxID=1185412 RepID=UPI00235609FC|nr:HAMP domain-containing sensor histidine kinase [Vallitalea guaymasensis]